jgi:predicted DCC family thiol-disulfide oxidoreductase YuxK
VNQVEVFFDGECPLCVREINMLRRLDAKRQRIRFTDIAAPAFRSEDYGKSFGEFMGSIQGRRASGEWIHGVEVFRELYNAVGFGPLVAMTRLPGVRQALEVGYRFFSKYRLRLTGRGEVCANDRCAVPQAR